LHDHLGSTVGVTDQAGQLVASQKYWPYGATRSGGLDPATQTDKQYTGQQAEPGDAGLGLYYKARFYSTVLGRFVSADPWAPDGTHGGLNRYAYALNNPLLFTDPSGYEPTQQDIDACAANLASCFAWTYGISPNGFVIVMGLGEGINGGLFGGPGDYWGYAEEFVKRYNPGCAGRAGECWDAALMLMKDSGPDAVYNVFGIMFIESDPGGHIWQGATGIRIDRGRGALADIVFNPRDKQLKGVIGTSLGAVTVADFLLTTPISRSPSSWTRLHRTLSRV